MDEMDQVQTGGWRIVADAKDKIVNYEMGNRGDGCSLIERDGLGWEDLGTWLAVLPCWPSCKWRGYRVGGTFEDGRFHRP